MEEKIRNVFQMQKPAVEMYSPLAYAYLGDSVYETIMRTVVLDVGPTSIKEMHMRSSSWANAARQAQIADILLPHMTEEEQRIYRRGRNATKHTSAKNQSLSDYHKATGLEAVIGYLYLCGQTERLLSLLQSAYATITENEES